MGKKLFSLCMALALCLGLLPATALAAGRNTVYVGGVDLAVSHGNIVYATTKRKWRSDNKWRRCQRLQHQVGRQHPDLEECLYYKCGTRETAIFTLSRVRQSAWPIRAGMRS